MMSSARCVWKCTTRFPSSTCTIASSSRSRGGRLVESVSAARSAFRYSMALTNFSRTSAADLAREPGNGGSPRELVPLAIFIPPQIWVMGSEQMSMSSMRVASRSLT